MTPKQFEVLVRDKMVHEEMSREEAVMHVCITARERYLDRRMGPWDAENVEAAVHNYLQHGLMPICIGTHLQFIPPTRAVLRVVRG